MKNYPLLWETSVLTGKMAGARRRLSICYILLPATCLARSLEEFARVRNSKGLRILIYSAVTQKLRPKIMSMRTRFTTQTTSFANGFLTLVLVVGMLNIEPFDSDDISGYNDHRVFFLTELFFNAEPLSQAPVFSLSEDVPVNDNAEDHFLSSHFHTTFFGPALVLIQNTDQVNTRPIYSSHNHTRSFNIPHQNSDEDAPFIFPVDVG